jgi:capsular exopolysaccharide synthesis family protein
MRSVFAKLSRLLPDGRSGVILLTSPEPQDGKTTLSLALAAAAVAVDRKATLLDLDLRRPTMARLLALDSERPDLLSYLSGEATLEDCIQSCPSVPLLHVLASFRAAGDPAALLMNAPLRALLERLRASGRIVIINAPPALAVADATMLAEQADLGLLVLHWGRTTEEVLRRAVSELGREMSGVILNHVAPAYAPRAAYENYAYHRDDGRLRQFLLTRWRADRALATAGASRPSEPTLGD